MMWLVVPQPTSAVSTLGNRRVGESATIPRLRPTPASLCRDDREFRSRKARFGTRVSGGHFSISVAARLRPVRKRPETGSLNGYALAHADTARNRLVADASVRLEVLADCFEHQGLDLRCRHTRDAASVLPALLNNCVRDIVPVASAELVRVVMVESSSFGSNGSTSTTGDRR
jgi:hypothetical protein